LGGLKQRFTRKVTILPLDVLQDHNQ
jgi:hypothetical protein